MCGVTCLKASLTGLFVCFQWFGTDAVQQSPLGSPKVNYHTVTDLGFDVASQMERAGMVTHDQSNATGKPHCGIPSTASGKYADARPVGTRHHTEYQNFSAVTRTSSTTRPDNVLMSGPSKYSPNIHLQYIPGRIMAWERLRSSSSK
jgi:hypothetical protein